MKKDLKIPTPLDGSKQKLNLELKIELQIFTNLWIKTEIKLNIEIRSENPHHPGWTKIEIKIKLKMKILTTQDGPK